jgi:hypothetical protein
MWGPGAYTPPMAEPYNDSPDGVRLVQYTDKSRMEINDPTGDPNELWFVTNGLLVVEMVDGNSRPVTTTSTGHRTHPTSASSVTRTRSVGPSTVTSTSLACARRRRSKRER